MQTRLFIGGAFVDAVDGGTVEVLDPHDCSVLAEVAEARADDVDRAVARAADEVLAGLVDEEQRGRLGVHALGDAPHRARQRLLDVERHRERLRQLGEHAEHAVLDRLRRRRRRAVAAFVLERARVHSVGAATRGVRPRPASQKIGPDNTYMTAMPNSTRGV